MNISKISFPAPRFRTVLIALIPWAFVFAALKYREQVVVQSKDPALYTGICRKTTGYEYACSLEQWLLLEPYPGVVGILTLLGFIFAAAISGAVYIASLPQQHPFRMLLRRLREERNSKVP